MLDRNALKAEIVKKGMNCVELSKKLGMTQGTFYKHMKKQDFGIDDCQKMIEILEIKEPESVFFAREMT